MSRNDKEAKRYIKVIVDMVAIAAQATAFVVWPLLDGRKHPRLWLIPVAVFLTSCGWWENYVTKQSPIGNFEHLKV